MSIYIMSCYKLPMGYCNDIEAILSKFQWGSKHGEREREKSLDELGKTGTVNKNIGACILEALLILIQVCWGSIAEDYLHESNPCQEQSSKAYKPISSILNAKTSFSPSYAWKSILNASELISTDFKWRIENEKNVKVWKDN